MIETLMKIKEAEQEVANERLALVEELQQLRITYQRQLQEKEAETEQALATYRETQQSEAEAHYTAVKLANHQRFTGTSAQLDKQFIQRQARVVENVLKEVEDIYGHF